MREIKRGSYPLKITLGDPIRPQASPQLPTLVAELANTAAYNLLHVDSGDLSCVGDKQVAQLTPHLEVALGLLALESGVIQDLDPLLGRFRVLLLRDQELNKLLGILGMHLHVSPPDPDCRLSGCRVGERKVQLPDPTVLGKWQCAKRAVKCPTSLGYQTLLEQEGQVVEPDSRHFVEEDQRAFEAVIDLIILFLIFSGIKRRNVFNPQIQVLRHELLAIFKKTNTVAGGDVGTVDANYHFPNLV